MAPYNPPIAHYCHVSVSNLTDETILKAIGKAGYHFKKITNDCGANYIWWNKDLKVIEIWGPFSCMTKTKNTVENHLEKYALIKV